MLSAVAVALCVAGAGAARGRGNLRDSNVPTSEQFATFKGKFGKSYNSPAEEAQAFANWQVNDVLIATHNEQPLPFTIGHNKFSDMSPMQFREAMLTPDLWRRKMAMDKASRAKVAVHKKGDYGLHEMLPQSVDWTAMNAITQIEDQGMCAGSWAFSAVASIESAHFIAQGMKEEYPVTKVSRQQLLDCGYGPAGATYSDHGCKGGLPAHGFGWTQMHGGLCTEADYPFLSSMGYRHACRVRSCQQAVTVSGFKDVQKFDEDALQDAVAQQPVTVAIAASMPVFQFYEGGVFDDPLGKASVLDHTMVVVGYGSTTAGVNYWKLKNSWGTTWGMDGYMLLKRNVNMCGIATMPAYPIGVKVVEPDAEAPVPEPATNRRGHNKPLDLQPTTYDGACAVPADGDVKLTSYPSGNVLLWYDGEWHTVCQEAANPMFASQVCKRLGFKRVDYQGDKTQERRFPMVSSPHCTGTESSLNDCRFDQVYKNDKCDTFRNMLAMFVTCADGEMTDYAFHCGYQANAGTASSSELRNSAAAATAGPVASARHVELTAVLAVAGVLAVAAGAAIGRLLAARRRTASGEAPAQPLA